MEERLTPEIEAGGYRIVQEALTNVAKHAQATTLPRLPAAADADTVIDHRRRRRRVRSGRRTPGAATRGLRPGRHPRARRRSLRGTLRLESAPGQGHAADGRAAGAVRQIADGAWTRPSVA